MAPLIKNSNYLLIFKETPLMLFIALFLICMPSSQPMAPLMRNIHIPLKNILIPLKNILILSKNILIPLKNILIPLKNIIIPLMKNFILPFATRHLHRVKIYILRIRSINNRA